MPVRRRATFTDKEDGEFRLEGLRGGDWMLFCSTAEHPGGQPQAAAVKASSETEVVIDLPAPIRGVGRVVDGSTGTPLQEAKVQVYSSGGMEKAFPWGRPLVVGADGTFDADAFTAGTNFVVVEAAGYAPHQAQASSQQDLVDFGDIGLSRPQTLELRLTETGSIGVEVTALRAFSSLGFELPETHFSSEGVVRFENVPPGNHRPIIEWPDGSWIRPDLRLDPGENWVFEVAVGGHRRLIARIVGSDGLPAAFDAFLMLGGQEDTGLFVTRFFMGAADNQFIVEGIRAKQIQVMVFKDDSSPVASRDVLFNNSSTLEIEIRIDEAPMQVRVVDTGGEPLAGAWVTVRSASGVDVHAADDTDSTGNATLHGVPESAVLVDVKHGIAGRRQGISLDARVREHEIVLDARGSLELRLLDGEDPLSVVAARIETSGGVSLSDARQSDTSGLVRFEPVGEGSYRIGLTRSDCWPVVVERSLAPEEHARVDVQMRRLADLDLSLVNAERVPVTGVEVELRSLEFDVPVADWLAAERVRGSLTSDARGVVHLEGLPRGTYTWSVELDDGSVEGTLELLPAQRNAATARLVR
jgi:hypothetical protein